MAEILRSRGEKGVRFTRARSGFSRTRKYTQKGEEGLNEGELERDPLHEIRSFFLNCFQSIFDHTCMRRHIDN